MRYRLNTFIRGDIVLFDAPDPVIATLVCAQLADWTDGAQGASRGVRDIPASGGPTLYRHWYHDLKQGPWHLAWKTHGAALAQALDSVRRPPRRRRFEGYVDVVEKAHFAAALWRAGRAPVADVKEAAE